MDKPMNAEDAINRLRDVKSFIGKMEQLYLCGATITGFAEAQENLDKAIALLKELPEIIRCKDCKNLGNHNICPIFSPRNKFYCGHGERKQSI